ncbi:ferric reductase like transmembrane component-domain-containing protein [Phyllosticta citribraziliensis]|uniref:ferric-chelate reductase (NADPH) n=1 Tax=Phyllosticta citribraziliensis TaxID=989973 RepID=A0ABR1LMB6_9PEZI
MSRWPNEPLPEGTGLEDLPITNSHCTNKSCKAFTDGFNQSEHQISLMGQVDYGWWMLCYWGTWVLIFTLAHIVRMSIYYSRRRRNTNLSNVPSWTHRLVASYRALVYRRFSARHLRRLGLPSFGVLALLSLSTIFTACLIFPELPYLRSRFRFGSPPLSIRCAMIISALMPLLVALGGKVNVITVLTGSSYARLNIYHRYIGGLIFALATVHMIPHFVAPIQDGGYDHLAQLFIDKKRELSGTMLYFIFLLMMLFSIPCFRARFYEFFAYTHFFLAFCFIGLLWWHIHGEYMSPTYIYVAAGLWTASALLRMTHRNPALRNGKLRGFQTTIEALPGNATRVTVRVPQNIAWKAGQHAFIRIPSISVKDNHPFSIASMPALNDPLLPGPKQANELVFLIGERKGFTHKLAERARRACPSAATSSTAASSTSSAEKKPVDDSTQSADVESQNPAKIQLRSFIDGPYGDHLGPVHRLYDCVVLVASGTGVAFTLPWATHLANQMALARADGSHRCRVRDVRLVWIVRQADQVSWVREQLDAALLTAAASRGRFVLDVFVTREKAAPASSTEAVLPATTTSLRSSGVVSPKRKHQDDDKDALRPSKEKKADERAATLAPSRPLLSVPQPCHSKHSSFSSLASTASTLCPPYSAIAPKASAIHLHFAGRPDLRSMVPRLVRGMSGDAKNSFVLACGSAPVVDAAIGQGVVAAQKLVGKGEGKGMFGVKGVGEKLSW